MPISVFASDRYRPTCLDLTNQFNTGLLFSHVFKSFKLLNNEK